MTSWHGTCVFAARLDVVDFGGNAAAPRLGSYGMLSVRWGKATKGSAPRRRNVCTVMPSAAEAVAEYVAEIRPTRRPDQR